MKKIISSLIMFAMVMSTLGFVPGNVKAVAVDDKVVICHATGSGYNEIEIDLEGTHGHEDHEDDIIPKPEGGCPTIEVTPDTSVVTLCKVDEQDSPLSGWTLMLDDSTEGESADDYSGVTGENGCVSFSEVPYGNYEVSETMQEGWENVSGNNAEVTVDNETETFTVKNQQIISNPTTATISAKKVVCDSEEYLPNWGDHKNSSAVDVNITSTTAAEWVAQSEGKCHLASWNFEWAPSSTTNPGDNMEVAGGAWTSFTNTASVSLPIDPSYVWVREQIPSTYIPFNGNTTNPSNTDVSAEFYCHVDVLNYDNFDRIDNMAAGETYHCVGFNVLKTEVRACDTELNLLENGDFEAPVLANGTWDIIPDSNPLLKWLVAWINLEDEGTLGLEIQNHVAGNPFEGNQHAELDGDHPVTIWQDVPTVPGKEYSLTFKYSPRPGKGALDNSLQVKFNGTTSGADIAVDGTANGNTVWETVTRNFVATSASTKVEIYDNGTDSSFGGYVDDASFKCVGNPNVPPIANAGVDQTLVLPTNSTTLNGSASTDSDGTITSYVWNFISGPTTVDPADVVSPSINSLVLGTYVFELVVTDDDGATDSDTVSIMVNPNGGNENTCDANLNLIQNGGFEDPVLSNPSWSIVPDSNPLLKWMVAWVSPQIAGTLGLEIQNHANGNPFAGMQHAELDGDHPVTIWQDITTVPGKEYSLTFKYSPRPGRNLADNSLQVKINGMVVGADIAVDGTPNGDTVWQTITRTFVATGTTTKVEIYDNGTDSSFGGYVDEVNLKCVGNPVSTPNLPPVSNAGSDQTLTLPTTSTTLNGTGSTDSDGTIVSYVWSFVSGPSTINPDDVVSPNISSLVAGTYVFELVVTDDDGATDDDTVSITVNPASNETNNISSNDESSGGGSSGSRVKKNADGEVLGAETESICSAVESYMRRGYEKNDKTQVKILQEFLNAYMKSGLTVDSFYGLETEAAVKAFQLARKDNVLTPWGLTAPTGIFYKTSLAEAKRLMCPETFGTLPIPTDLIPWSKEIGSAV